MSNLYASRVSTEHPITTWPLDDGASYISLMNDWQRQSMIQPTSAGLTPTGISVGAMAGWTAAQQGTLARGVGVPFPDDGIVSFSILEAGTTGASDAITVGFSCNLDEAVGTVPVAASAYIFFEDAWATSVDIGSYDDGTANADSTVNYTRNYISSTIYGQWVKVQTSAIDPADDTLFIRFNLTPSVDQSIINFDVNGVAVGQGLEAYSSTTLGVEPRKIGPYLKGVGVDITSTDYSSVAEDIVNSGANTVTLPIKVVMDTELSESVYVDDDSLAFAKKIYNNFHETRKIVLEPWPWIGAGNRGPDSTYSTHPANINPAIVSNWFDSWQQALTIVAKEMPRAWGMYVGTNMTAIEDETAEWIALMSSMREEFDGKIMYKTEWWETADATTKRDLGLWAGVDVAAVSAFFELINSATPTQTQIEAALLSAIEAQDLTSEILAIYDTWDVPVFLGDVTCPALEYGAYQPWDGASGHSANTNIQDRLIAAYQNVFSPLDGYIGLSVPYLNASDNFALDSSAIDRINWIKTAPVDNHKIKLVGAEPIENKLVGIATVDIADSSTILITGHSLANGDIVTFTDIETTGLNNSAEYVVVNSQPDQFNVRLKTSSSMITGGLTGDATAYLYVKNPHAYYAVENALLAQSTGIPLAFGSNSYTRLEPSTGPSFVFDGHGAFNEYGKGEPMTIEFWLRIAGSCTEDLKIFGPVESQDGLYINGSVFTLVVGGEQNSANIGSFSDPMLVHIRLRDNRVDLVVSGDALASVDIDTDTLSWPNASNQMLGFYSHDALAPIDIDCISVFSYLVPEVVAKRRFAWGQAVDTADVTNSIYSGQTLQSSFAESNVATSVSYPDPSTWESGVYSNLNVEPTKITVVDRPLPSIVLSGAQKQISIGSATTDVSEDLIILYSHGLSDDDVVLLDNLVDTTGLTDDGVTEYYVVNSTQSSFQISDNISGDVISLGGTGGTVNVTHKSSSQFYDEEEWLSDNKKIQNGSSFFSFQPNADWSGEVGYFSFDSLSEYVDVPRLFAVTWSASTVSGTEPIVTIRSKQDTSTQVKLYRDGADVKTDFIASGVTTNLETTAISVNNKYTFVVDLTASSYASIAIPLEMRYLFGSVDDIECIVGSDTSSSFTGNIYRMSFFNHYTYSNVSGFVSGYPTEVIDYDALSTVSQEALDKGTYNVFAETKHGSLYPEISQLAYWEDYIPMSTLAGYAYNYSGTQQPFVDQIQFNIGFPKPSQLDETMPIYAFFEELYGVSGLTYADWVALYPSMEYGINYDAFLTEYGLVGEDYTGLAAAYASMTYEQFMAFAQNPTSFLPYEVDDLEVRSFIALQRQEGLVQSMKNLSDTMPATSADIVYMDAWNIGTGELMEVVDGTTIVPIKTLSLDKMIVTVHLQIYAKATTKRPLSVKSLELASYTHNKDRPTDIGSKFGQSVYPFIDNGIYYDFSGMNPYRLDKRGFSQLYLGKESGFVPTGLEISGLDRGLATVIKEAATAGSTYTVQTFQFWIRVDDTFPTTSKKIYEISDGDTKISLYMSAITNNTDHASIVAVDENGDPYTSLSYYQNGQYVVSPVLSQNEWTSIALELDSEMEFTSNEPLIKIYPGAVYANITYFPPSPFSASVRVARDWSAIADELWSYWTLGTSFDSGESSWYEVLYPGTVVVNSETVAQKAYESSTGHDAELIESDSPLLVTQGVLRSTGNYAIVTQTQTPV